MNIFDAFSTEYVLALSAAIHAVVVIFIAAAGDRLDPLLIRKVPFDGKPDSLLEVYCRSPAKLVGDLDRIDGITPVMPEPVFDELDQRTTRVTIWQESNPLVKDVADRL